MKLTCSVSVGNRLLPALAINSKRRHVTSTLAIRKKLQSTEVVIILYNTHFKNGTTYEVKNIEKILTRFISEGKATIQFREPQHDLYIQADSPLLLRSFLNIVKLAVENRMSEKDLLHTSVPIKPMSVKPTIKKLLIEQAADIPAKGLPRTLEALCINNLSREVLDMGITQLHSLRVLDLSYNCLESLPSELSNLRYLNDFKLPFNQLGKATPKQWDWLGGNLAKALKLLDLRSNCLTYFPNQIMQLTNLNILRIDKNELKWLPSGIGTLKSLRVFTASSNLLTVMPSSTRKLRLQNLDLSDNNFNRAGHNFNKMEIESLPMFSLKEHGARRVLNLRLSFTAETLPLTIIKHLNSANYCLYCGSSCLSAFVRQILMLPLTTITQTFTTFSNPVLYSIPIDSYFCSLKCYNSTPINRRRKPIVR